MRVEIWVRDEVMAIGGGGYGVCVMWAGSRRLMRAWRDEGRGPIKF